MTLNLPDTLITSEQEKLPFPVRELFEENRPLPAGVAFFEEHFTLALLVKRIVIAALLFLIGAFLVPFSLEFLYLRHVDPKYREFINLKAFVAGLVFLYGGWLMLSSIKSGYALGRRQAAGERTRLGIFLVADALVSHSSFHTTIVPRGSFRGLTGNTLNYLLKDAPKSFNLPAEWVGASQAEVQQAIAAWGQAAPPQAVVQ